MPRSRLCRACKDFHDLDQAWPVSCYAHFGVSAEAGSGPQIISDTIEPFQSMATGEVFSSKSRYRQDLKARGFIEVGNDPQGRTARGPDPARERAERRQVIRDTYRQLGG